LLAADRLTRLSVFSTLPQRIALEMRRFIDAYALVQTIRINAKEGLR